MEQYRKPQQMNYVDNYFCLNTSPKFQVCFHSILKILLQISYLWTKSNQTSLKSVPIIIAAPKLSGLKHWSIICLRDVCSQQTQPGSYLGFLMHTSLVVAKARVTQRLHHSRVWCLGCEAWNSWGPVGPSSLHESVQLPSLDFLTEWQPQFNQTSN